MPLLLSPPHAQNIKGVWEASKAWTIAWHKQQAEKKGLEAASRQQGEEYRLCACLEKNKAHWRHAARKHISTRKASENGFHSIHRPTLLCLISLSRWNNYSSLAIKPVWRLGRHWRAENDRKTGVIRKAKNNNVNKLKYRVRLAHERTRSKIASTTNHRHT